MGFKGEKLGLKGVNISRTCLPDVKRNFLRKSYNSGRNMIKLLLRENILLFYYTCTRGEVFDRFVGVLYTCTQSLWSGRETTYFGES